MSNIQGHYEQDGQLLKNIESALQKMGKTRDKLSAEDLASVDEFHTGGRTATKNFLDHIAIKPGQEVLDIGCGIGGTARFLASHYASMVTGIDLTAGFINTGNALCEWTGLADKVTLQVGSALSSGFPDDRFDAACMLHVGMNIEDKEGLCKEMARILKPGAQFGIYDVMRIGPGDIAYPVPWASSAEMSFLAGQDVYTSALAKAGFEIEQEYNQLEFALQFMAALKKKNAENNGPPPLGLQLIMGEAAPVKVKNMVQAMADGIVAPIEIIASKPA